MARKILLADDSVTAQNMGRKILSDAGYDVITVNNGSAALKRVAEQKPDLIVLDVYMPGYSGLEVCQRLKDSADTERIPVLLTVGKLEPFKPEEARRVRADAYIIKPFEASELLSALARMEDRVVPAKSDGSRFGDGARKADSEGDADNGWKNRLRFPSKKKKEEPEPEVDTDLIGPSFRNFRRGRSKAPSAAPGKATPAPLEQNVVPDIPRDITPEELDALSALAAKLDAPATTEQSVSPAEEKAPSAQATPEFEVAAPSVEERNASEAPAEPQAVSEAPATNTFPEASAPVMEAEPVAVTEAKPAETVHVETLAVDEPAPVDREDEPAFATAVSAAEPVAQQETSVVPKVPPAGSEPVADANPTEAIEIQAKAEEPTPEEPKADEAPRVVDAVQAGEPPAVVAPAIEETPTPEATEAVPMAVAAEEAEVGPAPSEEELAEALRLLTPALGHTEASGTPTREAFIAAGAILAEEAARNGSEAPRWVAAAVALSPQECALSLEAEMFHTLAGTQSGAESAPTIVAGAVSAASAAAAEVELEIAAEAAAVPAAGSEAATFSVEAAQAQEQDLPIQVTQEEPAAATFADAGQHDQIEIVSTQRQAAPASDAAVPVEELAPPVVETMEVSNSEAAAGDEEAMAKERAKAGKSNWHQIRTGSTAAGSQDVVEAAKQAEPAEEAPKAMAAAAAADSALAPADPSAIASIVDSVLADLRPKIVEEIAKKLAGK